MPESLLNKVSGLRPKTLLKKRLWRRCFPVNFVKFLRTFISIEHLWWLLLAIPTYGSNLMTLSRNISSYTIILCLRVIISFNFFSSLFLSRAPFSFFFFYQGFLSRTLTTHRTAGEGRGPSFIPLYHSHPLTNIQTYICNFACEMTITYF